MVDGEIVATEKIIQIAASGAYVYALTDTGRIFASERGRKVMGWTEMPSPLDQGPEPVTLPR